MGGSFLRRNTSATQEILCCFLLLVSQSVGSPDELGKPLVRRISAFSGNKAHMKLGVGFWENRGSYENRQIERKNSICQVLAEKPTSALVLGRTRLDYKGKIKQMFDYVKIQIQKLNRNIKRKIRPQRTQAAGHYTTYDRICQALFFRQIAQKKSPPNFGGDLIRPGQWELNPICPWLL